MLMESWIEVAIIIFILCGIGLVLWKGGASNPVGTGRLEKRVSAVKSQVEKLSAKVSSLDEMSASSADVDQLRVSVDRQRERIKELFEGVAGLNGEIAALRKDGALQNSAIMALSANLKTLDADLKEHRAEVMKRLRLIEQIEGVVKANAKTADQASSNLALMLQRERETQAMLTKVATQGEATSRQLEHIVQLIVKKGMDA